jgi:hypothetical protein
MHRRLILAVPLLAIALAACSGDFDQRVEIARKIGEGVESIGSTVNPEGGTYVSGTVSVGGVVRYARVTLRRVRPDGSIDLDDSRVLASTVTGDTGGYHATLRDTTYRGPIVVEVRGQDGAIQAEGANPATSRTALLHPMRGYHTLNGMLPYFDGYSVGDVHVTPLTTCAIARSQFLGGQSAGMYGMCGLQVAQSFGLQAIRMLLPHDLCGSGTPGNSEAYGYLVATLSQVARNAGATNVFDFYEGLTRDFLDDGISNGSIGLIPNTGITMPDLTMAGVLYDALFNDYLAPGNVDRFRGFPDNTNVPPGDIAGLLNALTLARDVNGFTYGYDFTLRVPTAVVVARGSEFATRVFAVDQYGQSTILETLGDSGGPCFVDYQFVSSSPVNVSVATFGRITVPMGAAVGTYNVTLTVTPAAAQTFITGPTQIFNITVEVR